MTILSRWFALVALLFLPLLVSAQILSPSFSRNLTLGSRGGDVSALQQILISKGFLRISAPTGYFGRLTKLALREWQASAGISPAFGYFGPISRAALNLNSTISPPTAGPTIMPSITSLNTTSGRYYASVTITGTGFTPTGNRIKFGNLNTENDPNYNLASPNGTTLTFIVPKYPYVSCSGSHACIQYSGSGSTGTFYVSVINGNGTSNAASFTTLPPPILEP